MAGDALGSMVEFQSAATIRRRYPEGLRSLADDGAWNTIAGQPTDDSELALALGRSILTAGGYDPEAAAKAYAYWFRSGPFDVGTTTAQALRAISPLSAPPSALAAASMAAANGESQSNGSLMRMSPLGIWGHRMDPDELADIARADSRLTHPNSVCQEACALFVVAVAHAVGTGAPPSEVYGFARDWSRRSCRVPAVVDALAAAEHGPPTDFERNQGWVLLALQNAFYQLLQASSLEDGVVDTVMAGGDTDTNGAIAGALLGAVHGREALPAGWRRAILSCRPLAGLPGVKRPRPQPFWPVDALELAERLLLAGR
jgi:ADP-ribosylglycohydrolase